MTNEIGYTEPSKEQLDLMRKFAKVCREAIDIILKCETTAELQQPLNNASARIQEGMMWFNSYIANGGKFTKDNNSH